MNTYSKIFILALLMALTLPAVAHDGHGEDASSAFASVLHHYEAIWQTLADDSVDGVAEHAVGLQEAADEIAAAWSTEKAGLRNDVDTAEATEFFEKVGRAASSLAVAKDLASARDAFYAISLPMVRLNELVAGERLKVVYCSMTKKSWLQREAEVVNPYHGHAMAKCGDVIS